MATGNVSVVCFDLGGVLVRICRSWNEAVGTAGLDLRQPHGVDEDAMRARRWSLVSQHQVGGLSNADYYGGMSAAFDGLYSAQEMEHIHHAWTQEQYPGVDDLVAELNAHRGIETACLSNTNDAHWRRLVSNEYPAPSALTHQLASHVLGVAKPDSDIYAHAAEEFGADPCEILFFDDLPENVEAARRAGWQAEQVDPYGDTAKQMREVLRTLRVL